MRQIEEKTKNWFVEGETRAELQQIRVDHIFKASMVEDRDMLNIICIASDLHEDGSGSVPSHTETLNC